MIGFIKRIVVFAAVLTAGAIAAGIIVAMTILSPLLWILGGLLLVAWVAADELTDSPPDN